MKFLLEATGGDVDLAIASEVIILGFNVKTPCSLKSYAEKKGFEIRYIDLTTISSIMCEMQRNDSLSLLRSVES